MQDIKLVIVEATIKQDQANVATQWLQTLMYNDPNEPALAMTKFMLACIAQGHFQTKTSESGSWQAPNDVLTVADYLSHGSRIMVDYQQLSVEKKSKLQQLFSKDYMQPRCSTHAVVRDQQGAAKELKWFMLGVQGLLNLIRPGDCEIRDFGINIAMGGEGRTNYQGKKIEDNGYSGHLFVHHHPQDELLLFGLEQTAPTTGPFAVMFADVSDHGSEDEREIQVHSDQFDQGHSMVGASDTYTAAGSLYFDNPIYQAKLRQQCGAVPPIKYGGMMVTLRNVDWLDIQAYLQKLDENCQNADQLQRQLMAKPKLATKQVIHEYSDLDFAKYLKQCKNIFNSEADKGLHKRYRELRQCIETAQKSTDAGFFMKNNLQLQALIAAILAEHGDASEAHREAIRRIGDLFSRQENALSEQMQTSMRIRALEDEIEKAEQELGKLCQQLYVLKNEHSHEDAELNEFLSLLTDDIDFHAEWDFLDLLQSPEQTPEQISQQCLEKLNRDLEVAKNFLVQYELSSLPNSRITTGSTSSENGILYQCDAPLDFCTTSTAAAAAVIQERIASYDDQYGAIAVPPDSRRTPHTSREGSFDIKEQALIYLVGEGMSADTIADIRRSPVSIDDDVSSDGSLPSNVRIENGFNIAAQHNYPVSGDTTSTDTAAASVFALDGLTIDMISGVAMAIGGLAAALALVALLTLPASVGVTVGSVATMAIGLVSVLTGGFFYCKSADKSPNVVPDDPSPDPGV